VINAPDDPLGVGQIGDDWTEGRITIVGGGHRKKRIVRERESYTVQRKGGVGTVSEWSGPGEGGFQGKKEMLEKKKNL